MLNLARTIAVAVIPAALLACGPEALDATSEINPALGADDPGSLASASSALDPVFVTSCARVPTGPSSNGLPFVGDTELDVAGSRVVWQEYSGKAFVAPLDPVTGQLAGSPQVAATDVAPLDRTYNGPEWAFSQQGAQLVYTWSTQGSGAGPKTFGLAVARESSPGTWTVRHIAGKEGYFNPRATKTATDHHALIQFLVPTSGNVAWSTLADGQAKFEIPDSTDGHWADGEALLTYIKRSTGQVMLHDPTDPLHDRALTTDADTKERPYMWTAPELGRRMLFARVGYDLHVYLERVGAPFAFDPYRTIATQLDSPYNVIASPEPTVRNGKSYISYMATSTTLETDALPALTFLAPVALDGGDPILTSPDSRAARTDPETFGGTGPLLEYHTLVTAPPSKNLAQSALELYVCTTGL